MDTSCCLKPFIRLFEWRIKSMLYMKYKEANRVAKHARIRNIKSIRDVHGALAAWNLTSMFKVSNPAEIENTERELDPFNCTTYSDCDDDTKPCYCDDLCNMFNDCCINAPSRSDKTSSTSGLLQYMTCEEWNGYLIWVVTECPLESGETCADDGNTYDMRNVFVTDENNITYSNYRCALCHGVGKYVYWTFLMIHNMGPNSACKRSRNIICDDSDNSTESCINTLLGKGCDVKLYPPEGTSVRFCIETDELTTNMSCKAEYLPIQDKHGRKQYRNADCCAKLKGECSADLYTCYRRKSSMFGISWRSVSSYPSYTVFTFGKKCNDVSLCGEIKYFGITFILDLHFKYETNNPNIRDNYPVICLLKRYFEEMEDDLDIEDVYVRFWKASAANPFSLVVLNVRLKSGRTFRNEKDIQILKDHLGTMLFSIYVNDQDKVFLMDNTGEDLKEYNVSGLPKEEIYVRKVVIDTWLSITDNEVCETVQYHSDIPLPRCKHLNITFSTGVQQSITAYRCLSFASQNAQDSVTIGSTGGTVRARLDGNFLGGFLLPAIILTLISGIN